MTGKWHNAAIAEGFRTLRSLVNMLDPQILSASEDLADQLAAILRVPPYDDSQRIRVS